MKLHYFDQVAPDSDDKPAAQARALGSVPATCLLGGVLLTQFSLVKRNPCETCNGPRERCKGTVKLTEEEFNRRGGFAEIERLFTGKPKDPFQEET